MRKLRDVLRLRLSAQLSLRQIRDSLRLSLGAVQKITYKAEELGLNWPAVEQLDDRQLAQAIYPESDTRTTGSLQLPNWQEVFKELHYKNVTKHLRLPSMELSNLFKIRLITWAKYEVNTQ